MGIGEISGNLDEMIKENLPVATCYRNQLNEPIESTQPDIALQQLQHSFFLSILVTWVKSSFFF